MTRESLVIFLGLVVLCLPSLGIPQAWKLYGTIGLGIMLILLGYSLRHSRYLRSIEKENGERGTDSFVESNGSRSVAALE